MVTLKNHNEELDWRGHLERWHESGLTQSAYCKDNNIKLTTFSGWKSRLRKEQNKGGRAKSGLVKVPEQVLQRVGEAPGLPVVNSEMVLQVGDFKVALREDFSEPALRKLIRVLKDA